MDFFIDKILSLNENQNLSMKFYFMESTVKSFAAALMEHYITDDFHGMWSGHTEFGEPLNGFVHSM